MLQIKNLVLVGTLCKFKEDFLLCQWVQDFTDFTDDVLSKITWTTGLINSKPIDAMLITLLKSSSLTKVSG